MPLPQISDSRKRIIRIIHEVILVLVKQHTMKTCWRVEVLLHIFPVSTRDAGECGQQAVRNGQEASVSELVSTLWIGERSLFLPGIEARFTGPQVRSLLTTGVR
jgi:hypothetical protein